MSEHEENINKAEILKRIRHERGLLEEVLGSLSTGQMLKEGVQGNWTVKDMLAHITCWEQRMVGWMEQALRGETPEAFVHGFTNEVIDRWNAESYAANRGKGLKEVLAEFSGSYSDALRIVESTREEDLLEAERFPWRNGSPLWRMVAANTWWHYKMHREDIQSWLESGRSG